MRRVLSTIKMSYVHYNMIKRKKPKISNLIFMVFLLLLIIPQTRMPIQVSVHKLISKLIPVTIEETNREMISYDSWTLYSNTGKRIDFSNFENRVVVINFWATWCPPCVAEMGSLNELYKRYKNEEELRFLFISNEKDSIVAQFLEKNRYDFEVFSSLSEPPKALEVSSIPRTFIINKSGEIIVDKSGAADWNSKKVNDLIKSLIKS